MRLLILRGEKADDVTSQGEHGWINQEPRPLLPPDPDSLEDLWAEAEHKHAFLDMRGIAAGGEWLQAPFVSQRSSMRGP